VTAAPEDAITATIDVRAPIDAVYAMFTEPQELIRWIGVRAMLEPRPGGQFRFELMEGEFCSGRYLELDPPNKVVFTWGWESGALPVEPGSSTVTVELTHADGTTHVQLTHAGLSKQMREHHSGGWANFLPRLKAAAEA
jgi:uncharacterized protein YndB with AHSA1/START domain